MVRFWLGLPFFFFAVEGFLHRYPKLELYPPDGDGDPGKPLFLSPYVESGNITEGRRLARVPLTEILQIKSYAGLFTVNKTYNSNQFFWYFPAMISNKTDAPVLVWLQGGPGATSLFGLFSENGPIKVRNGKLIKRKYNWALSHHIIYIDNPVGTGFSFTNDPRGYCTDEIQIGEQLYSTIIQFFQLFPKLQKNKFYVTGESYAGKYIPALAYTIHKNNPVSNIKINLKGIAIGNGLSDPAHQIPGYGQYLYQLGFIDWNQAEIFKKYENKVLNYIRRQQWKEAFDTSTALFGGDKSVFANMTGFDFTYNFFRLIFYPFEDFGPMLQKSYVRKSIHVGDLKFNNGSIAENHLIQDVMQSIAPWISELLDHYSVLVYSGQLDLMAAYPLVTNYLKHLNFTGSDEYKSAKRNIWRVDGDVAGYVKRGGNLIEVMVRNSGEMVPGDQPRWALDMITRFTYEKTFYHVKKPHVGY